MTKLKSANFNILLWPFWWSSRKKIPCYFAY